MKLLVIGQGRHGKDTFCEISNKYFGLTFESSSHFACKEFIFDFLSDNYTSIEECYNDRHNHRKLWYDLICDYNKNNQARLSKKLLSEFDIYCGMRSIEEYKSSKKLFDLIIWVDASERLGITECSDSNTINSNNADIIIENNGTLQEFERKVIKLLIKLTNKCCGNWDDNGLCCC